MEARKTSVRNGPRARGVGVLCSFFWDFWLLFLVVFFLGLFNLRRLCNKMTKERRTLGYTGHTHTCSVHAVRLAHRWSTCSARRWLTANSFSTLAVLPALVEAMKSAVAYLPWTPNNSLGAFTVSVFLAAAFFLANVRVCPRDARDRVDRVRSVLWSISLQWMCGAGGGAVLDFFGP